MLKQLSVEEIKHALERHPYILLVEDEPVTQKVHKFCALIKKLR